MTHVSKIIVRPATAADVAQAVPLIYSAGPEAFDFMFSRYGKNALEYVENCFVDGRGLQGYKNHRVAVRELDDKVVGIGAFYSGVEYASLSSQTVAQIRRYYGTVNLLKMLPGLLAMGRWMKAPSKHTDYVANLGVAPDTRGQGVGTILLQDGLDRAKQRGKRVYALDVAVTNPDAERLYRRFGMEQRWEAAFSNKASINIPAARRLLMPIE